MDIPKASYEQDFKYNWSLKLKRGKCAHADAVWWVCTECEDQRARLKEKTQLSRHNK